MIINIIDRNTFYRLLSDSSSWVVITVNLHIPQPEQIENFTSPKLENKYLQEVQYLILAWEDEPLSQVVVIHHELIN